MLHGFYSGIDILKMLAGFVLAVRLAMRRRPDRELFAREYAATMPEKSLVEGNSRRGKTGRGSITRGNITRG